MATSDEKKMEKKPLWLLIEEKFLELNLKDLSGGKKEAAIQKIAGELDTEGYNVSRDGGNLLQLRWAMGDMIKVGRPLMRDFNDATSPLSLEDVIDPYSATTRLIDDLGKTWKEIRKSDRRSEVIRIIERTRLDLLIKKAKSMPGDEGIRFLITPMRACRAASAAAGGRDRSVPPCRF